MQINYDSDMTVGQMLSYYVEQRQAVRTTLPVWNIPSFKQVRALCNFGSIYARQKEVLNTSL